MFISIDVGGTNIRFGLLDSNLADPLIQVKSFPVNQTYEKGISHLIDELEKFIQNEKVSLLEGVGIGLPGEVDRQIGMVNKAQNLPDWNMKPLASILKEKFGAPIKVHNDAVLGGLGEAFFGLGKDVPEFIYLIWGTGFGGVRIEKILSKVKILPFEPGNQIIQKNGYKCPCGQSGCLEAYIGGAALERVYGMPASSITDERIWDEVAQHAAQGILNVIVMHNPALVVFGGGLIHKRPNLLEKIDSLLEKELYRYQKPPLVLSKLNENGALYGGLALFQITEI
jgi:glucokinase